MVTSRREREREEAGEKGEGKEVSRIVLLNWHCGGGCIGSEARGVAAKFELWWLHGWARVASLSVRMAEHETSLPLSSKEMNWGQNSWGIISEFSGTVKTIIQLHVLHLSTQFLFSP